MKRRIRAVRRRAAKWAPAVSALAIVVALAVATSASATGPAPGWTIESYAAPTNLSTSDNSSCTPTTLESQTPACAFYQATVRNAGSVASREGAEVSIGDVPPKGLTVAQARLFWPRVAKMFGMEEEENVFPLLEALTGSGLASCSLSTTISCSVSFSRLREVELCAGAQCSVAPDEEIKLIAYVTVDEPAVEGPLVNSAKVSGGGAPSAETQAADSANRIGPPVAFGFSHFNFYASGLDGARDTQAGAHPYELTTTIGMNSKFRVGPADLFEPEAIQDIRDVVTDLPVGFVGSILAAPQCTFSQLSSHIGAGVGGCPHDTIVGHILTEPKLSASVNGPIYNMTPERGFPAEFAYVDELAGPHVFYARVVPTPKGYVLQVMNPEIPAVDLRTVVVTFYGDPGAKQEELAVREGKLASPIAPIPFFTNPTDCAGEEPTATIYMDSWQNPAKINSDGTPANLNEPTWVKAESKSPPVTGCHTLQFSAEINAQPTTHESDKPSGMEFEIKQPQTETVGVSATPTLKKAVVTLPEGFTADPSAASGLAACSETQIGWEEGATGPLKFNAAPPACPEASKIGSLELETPLIGRKLEGEMFLASQNENPFHTTLAAYVVVDDPITGVLIKIAGELLADPHTGRLTAIFDENPNLPFSDLKLHFFGGPRAELATPESCGTFTVNAELTPWSFPDSGPAATPFDNFVIDEACPGGFAPTFTGGSSNLQAGAFTPIVASFQRSDTDQELAGLTVTLPQGLLGKIAGVQQCTEAQVRAAETGTGGCPEASLVGSVTAGAGPGPNPVFVSGKAYLTGPYNGGPYGLAVVVPAVAGPFDFGTVVVRQSLRIDPRTAQVTDVSDPFPTIIDGIPLRLRRVDVTLNRERFAFNPTNCGKLGFAGSMSGSPLGAPTSLNGTVGHATQAGASAPFATPFEVTNCASLRFTPKISVTTKARASKANGASLHFKITYPAGAMGTQSWFQEAKFSLPKQLPARLETLQRACLSNVFETNRAACPSASKIGTAVVHTPVLPDPLTGTVYFVSYGGEKFPEAVVVLQGDDVTVELHGETFISKAGITSATFRSTPDVPFESIEVNIPTGRYSEFGTDLPARAKYNFCNQKLTMPTLFKAQNGLEIHQNTPITVVGCHKKKHKHAKHHH